MARQFLFLGAAEMRFFNAPLYQILPPPAVHLVTVNNEGDLTFSI